MKKIRNIKLYKHYFKEFYTSQEKSVRDKINYSLYMVETQRVIHRKFFRFIDGSDGIYEIRTEYNENIYRVFCCMDEDSVVVLFNAFQKKTQKTPLKEIKIAEKLKKEYFDNKRRITI